MATDLLRSLIIAAVLPAASVAAGGAGPAEMPPPGFEGRQYVDSEGCAFVRGSLSGEVMWVPRIGPDGEPVCGLRPTMAAGAPSVVPGAEAGAFPAESAGSGPAAPAGHAGVEEPSMPAAAGPGAAGGEAAPTSGAAATGHDAAATDATPIDSTATDVDAIDADATDAARTGGATEQGAATRPVGTAQAGEAAVPGGVAVGDQGGPVPRAQEAAGAAMGDGAAAPGRQAEASGGGATGDDGPAADLQADDGGSAPADPVAEVLAAEFVLQAGAFRTEKAARAWAARIKGIGPSAVVVPPRGKRGYFRVMVGPFSDQEAMREASRQLRRKGVDNFPLPPGRR